MGADRSRPGHRERRNSTFVERDGTFHRSKTIDVCGGRKAVSTHPRQREEPPPMVRRLAMLAALIRVAWCVSAARAHAAAVPDHTTAEAGNPFVDGWYADPDVAI